MTETEAREWVYARYGDPAIARLERFAAMLADVARRQNLVARSTLDAIWSRHLVDSAQLADGAGGAGPWLDIGTGGGMPGLVLALLLDRPFVLAEPRRLRAEFLRRCVDAFGIGSRVIVEQRPVEALRVDADTISARAVAPIDRLIAAARHCASGETRWIMPRGKSGADEVGRSTLLAEGEFHVKQSVTDPEAIIVVARGIGRR